jgi:hypothetical protein
MNAVDVSAQACGGSMMPMPSTSSCQPACHGHVCGDDGCGGSCGSCGFGQHCSNGHCADNCTPDCTNKQCGDDGCGGSCGTCDASKYCNTTDTSPSSGTPSLKGQCLAPNWCVGLGIYSDACEQGCCPAAPYHEYTETHDSLGTYHECSCRTTCIPADDTYSTCLEDKDCCSDSKCSTTPGFWGGVCTGGCWKQSCTASRANGGCCESHPYCNPTFGCTAYQGLAGGDCIDDAGCESGLTCVNMKCKAPCTASCTGKSCGDDGCGGSCGTCASGSCVNGSCCVPNCTGKTCGDNGCGGSCGSCGAGTCISGSCCMPSCGGKTCGDNGCGGSCGTCGTGKLCSSGGCVTDPNYCDPVTNTLCNTPNQCILLANETTTCALAGTGTQGSSCSAATPCAGGYSCFAGSCRKICLKSTGEGCSIGSTCNGVSGWVTYGACT